MSLVILVILIDNVVFVSFCRLFDDILHYLPPSPINDTPANIKSKGLTKAISNNNKEQIHTLPIKIPIDFVFEYIFLAQFNLSRFSLIIFVPRFLYKSYP